MPDIQGTLDGLVDLLTGVGVAAGCDTAKLNPPCAWVHADRLTVENLDGGGTLSAYIDLVVPGWAYPRVMAGLTKMLNAALGVITPDGAVDTDVVVDLAGGKTLPAFRIPIDLDINP